MTKHTIQYRQLKTNDLWDSVDLKAMLVDVLRRREQGKVVAESARLRIIDLDQDQSFVILNKLSDTSTWDGPVFAGQLIHLQHGSDIHAVVQSLDEDAPEFVVQSLTLSARTRVLKGALYFAVVGNHVGLIEGQQVRGRTLERYLTTLLQGAEELDPGQAIILNGSFQTGDGKELSESSEITVSAVDNRGPAAPPVDVANIVEHEAARTSREGATVFDVLRTLGWGTEAINRLHAEVPDGSRSKPISRATINEALRNINPADLGLKGDGREKGGIVKLSVQRPIRTVGSLIDPSDAMEQIVNALKDWATAEKIDCSFDG